MSISDRMTPTNLARAHQQIKDVCSYGSNVVLVGAGTRDEFGSKLTESRLTLKAFPVRYAPYDRQTRESIAWAEDTEILCYISKSALDDEDLTINKLKKKYRTMEVVGRTYEIRYIDYNSSFANDFLYIVIGGKK